MSGDRDCPHSAQDWTVIEGRRICLECGDVDARAISNEVDVNGLYYSYLGKATRQSDGTWRCLANVHGNALCIVEVAITASGCSCVCSDCLSKRKEIHDLCRYACRLKERSTHYGVKP